MVFTDKTAMPLSGTVTLADFAGFSPEIRDALKGKECSLAGVSVCAYNTVDDSQVSAHMQPLLGMWVMVKRHPSLSPTDVGQNGLPLC